jgi:hypothetical protein
VDVHGNWNWTLLQNWIPNQLQHKIAAVVPPHSENCRDEQLGVGGKFGEFSVATMYNKLRGFNKTDADSVWNRIWKLGVTERVRSFVWLVKWDRLLTNYVKNRMGLSTDMCDYCRNSKETTFHALQYCVLVRPVWLSLVDASRRHQFFSSNLHEWIATNVANKGSKNYYDDWSCVWVVACHLVWSWRNKEKYDDKI